MVLLHSLSILSAITTRHAPLVSNQIIADGDAECRVRRRFRVPDVLKPIDENRTRLVICTPGTRLLYEYDFGDGWQHALLLEEVLLGDDIPKNSHPCASGGIEALSSGRVPATKAALAPHVRTVQVG